MSPSYVSVLLFTLAAKIIFVNSWDVNSTLYFEQDDILLNDELKFERSAVSNKNLLWPDKTVYYYIDETMYTQSESTFIQNSLKVFADETCIKMVPMKKLTDAPYFIYIRKALGCFSDIGCLRRKRGQRMSLGMTCLDSAHVIHEFMHALGFYHEQNRPDRDDHVRIYFKNINIKHNSSYRIIKMDTLGVDYDYHSIMHYTKYQNAINPNLPTMVNIYDSTDNLGGDHLTKSDISRINKLYNC